MFLKQLNKSLKHYNKLIMHYFIYKLQRSEIAREPFEKVESEKNTEIRKEEKDY